jgi:hypothetical protein
MLAAKMGEHHEDQREFMQDPHTGRASMVRAMAQQWKFCITPIS